MQQTTKQLHIHTFGFLWNILDRVIHRIYIRLLPILHRLSSLLHGNHWSPIHSHGLVHRLWNAHASPRLHPILRLPIHPRRCVQVSHHIHRSRRNGRLRCCISPSVPSAYDTHTLDSAPQNSPFCASPASVKATFGTASLLPSSDRAFPSSASPHFPPKSTTERFALFPVETVDEARRRRFGSFPAGSTEEPRGDSRTGRFGAASGCKFGGRTAGAGVATGSPAGISLRLAGKSIRRGVSLAGSESVGGEKTAANPLRRFSAKRAELGWNWAELDWNWAEPGWNWASAPFSELTAMRRALSCSWSGEARSRSEPAALAAVWSACSARRAALCSWKSASLRGNRGKRVPGESPQRRFLGCGAGRRR